MKSNPQMKDLLTLKDKDNDSLLVFAVLSKNAKMFNAVITWLGYHLSSQLVL